MKFVLHAGGLLGSRECQHTQHLVQPADLAHTQMLQVVQHALRENEERQSQKWGNGSPHICILHVFPTPTKKTLYESLKIHRHSTLMRMAKRCIAFPCVSTNAARASRAWSISEAIPLPMCVISAPITSWRVKWNGDKARMEWNTKEGSP